MRSRSLKLSNLARNSVLSSWKTLNRALRTSKVLPRARNKLSLWWTQSLFFAGIAKSSWLLEYWILGVDDERGEICRICSMFCGKVCAKYAGASTMISGFYFVSLVDLYSRMHRFQILNSSEIEIQLANPSFPHETDKQLTSISPPIAPAWQD